MRVTGTHLPRVPTDGDAMDDPCCRPLNTLPQPERDVHVPVRCQGSIYHAMLDSGCTQAKVNQNLVEWVEVRCMQGGHAQISHSAAQIMYKSKRL